MKFFSSCQPALLVTATIATVVATNIAPSTAQTPNPTGLVQSNDRLQQLTPPALPGFNPALLNVNLIQNGNFASGLANWTATNAIADRVIKPNFRAGIIQPRNGQLLQQFKINVGAKYRVSFDVQTPVSTDRANYKISTASQFSNASFKLSDLSSTPNGSFSRFSFEITGANRSGSTATSITDTITFTNNSSSTNFVITNVTIKQI
jgi:hypothetical protein